MVNKSFNLQKEIKNDSGAIAGFLTSQISVGYGGLNISIQIVDRSYIESHPDVLRDEYMSFVKEVELEAINNGWDALKN